MLHNISSNGEESDSGESQTRFTGLKANRSAPKLCCPLFIFLHHKVRNHPFPYRYLVQNSADYFVFCILIYYILYHHYIFLDSFIVFTNLFSHDTFLTFLRNHNAAFPALFPSHIDRLALSTDVLLSYPPPFSLASLLPIFLSGVALHSFMRQKACSTAGFRSV